ncbi:class I SAM-dependent methyltransferase [Polynucleobacter paneuropaeus]|nr:class I SAM-dependent methyltransferase [Polynucleobacter paneuropaeus]
MSTLENLTNDSALISQKTIAHYDQNAVPYYEGTKDHDVSQNIDALLRAIKTKPPFHILDFGCGPGRDLRTFTKLGHIAIGLEGSEQAAQIARTKSGCEILVQDFFNLNLPESAFDGIFANASLFHIPKKLLPKVLGNLWASLKPNGILFSSNPRGNNEESWYGDRFGSYHDLEGWRSFMMNSQFTEIEHYYRPEGIPIEQRPWLASVWKK